MRAVAQANLSASLHDPRKNQFAWVIVDAEPRRKWRRLIRSVKQQPIAAGRSTGVLGMARTYRHAD